MSLEFMRETSRVLIVGVGGVGCEVLKNLILKRVAYIDIIDMDTIELSNLNRQFMFATRDIGRAKAEVAAEWILKGHPQYSGKLRYHVGRIEDCPDAFYSQFHLVVSALDSIEARRWLNAKIVHLGRENPIPLIDTASEGFKGHVRLVIPSITACIECMSSLYADDERVPLCTLAGSPRNLGHCLEWVLLNDETSPIEVILEKTKQRALDFGIDASNLSKRFIEGFTKRVVPSLASTNAIIGGIASQMIGKVLGGPLEVENNFIFYNGAEGIHLTRLRIDRLPDCYVCRGEEKNEVYQ
jgi:ubiquitin-activating enzyme E1 C